MKKKQTTLPPTLGGDEGTLSVSAATGQTVLAPSPLSDTESAARLFAEEIQRLPGVLRVEQWGEEGAGVPTFHAYVRPDDRDTEYSVYEVKGQVYDRYPEAYLEVVVLEATGAPGLNGEAPP